MRGEGFSAVGILRHPPSSHFIFNLCFLFIFFLQREPMQLVNRRESKWKCIHTESETVPRVHPLLVIMRA